MAGQVETLTVDIQSGTTNTLYAVWSWSKHSTTEAYWVRWEYRTEGPAIWFIASEDQSSNHRQSTYQIPDNAIRVRVTVKPICKTRIVKGKEVTDWVATAKTVGYDVRKSPPLTPTAPTPELEDFLLRVKLANLNVNATSIQFQVVKVVKGALSVFKTSDTTIRYANEQDENNKVNGYAQYSCYVDAGYEYRVRCRSARDGLYSEWSDYSGGVWTIPATPTGITTCRANSETSVYLAWSAVDLATSYDIEYTTKKEYFDTSGEVSTQTGIEFTNYEVTGLESGQEYFFRVRAVNSEGYSSWTGIVSVAIGEPPTAPTTWSSTTTVIVGEKLMLYWMHNTEDNSAQTYAEVELDINGSITTETINTVDEEDEEKTMYYEIDTSKYTEGTKLSWRVRTAGVTKTYGDWSIQRTVDIYAPPVLSLQVNDINGSPLETLTTYPFTIKTTAGPKTQKVIGYHLTIVSNNYYETVDTVGNSTIVNVGQEVYSKHFDTTKDLDMTMTGGEVYLENAISYTLTCTVSMDSGLTAEDSCTFEVLWDYVSYDLNARISIDSESCTASIQPYCENSDGTLVEGVLLSVYRREFDGSYTELATNIDNLSNTFITDPHPALDYARYRIVGKTVSTGAIFCYDLPAYPVGETAIIIQWNEDCKNFDATNTDPMADKPWSGSLLRLPYNIDVSEDYSSDVTFVKYIGRKHPIAYYGTHIGESATWDTEIPKSDKETLYALRRLAIYMGDVYVREPSGTGYWANVEVSFGQKHLEVKIPVSLKITRVAGGA